MAGYALTLPRGWMRFPVHLPHDSAVRSVCDSFDLPTGDHPHAVRARRRAKVAAVALVERAQDLDVLDLFVLRQGRTGQPFMSLATSLVRGIARLEGTDRRGAAAWSHVELPSGPALQRRRQHPFTAEDAALVGQTIGLGDELGARHSDVHSPRPALVTTDLDTVVPVPDHEGASLLLAVRCVDQIGDERGARHADEIAAHFRWTS